MKQSFIGVVLAAGVAPSVFLMLRPPLEVRQGGGDPQPRVQNLTDDLHPALRIDSKTALALFDQGYADAEKKRNLDKVVGKVRRGIGSIRVNRIGSTKTVSWLTALTPQLMIYSDGFMARKQYRDKKEVEESRKKHGSDLWLSNDRLALMGSIGLYPSFGGGSGRIDRHADPADLKDVRVVLKVGDKIYQPLTQPGTLEADSGIATNDVATTGVSTSYVNARITGSRGYATGRATVRNYYTIHQEESYRWYEGQFNVEFLLFNPDGSARIQKKDKQIEVIVIYGSNERHAHYKLDDFAKIAG